MFQSFRFPISWRELALVYYFAPDADQDWAFITPGSTLATVLWLTEAPRAPR